VFQDASSATYLSSGSDLLQQLVQAADGRGARRGRDSAGAVDAEGADPEGGRRVAVVRLVVREERLCGGGSTPFPCIGGARSKASNKTAPPQAAW